MNNFRLLLATRECLNFETQKKCKYYTKFKAYKLCQLEFSVFKEKEHFIILNREEPMDCNTVTWTQCELLDDSTSYLLKNAPHFSSSFMTTGLENLSIPAKTHHLLLTSVTQNNIDKRAEERSIKHFPLTLSCFSQQAMHLSHLLPVNLAYSAFQQSFSEVLQGTQLQVYTL